MEIKFDLVKDKDSELGYLWTSIVGEHKPITPAQVQSLSNVSRRLKRFSTNWAGDYGVADYDFRQDKEIFWEVAGKSADDFTNGVCRVQSGVQMFVYIFAEAGMKKLGSHRLRFARRLHKEIGIGYL